LSPLKGRLVLSEAMPNKQHTRVCWASHSFAQHQPTGYFRTNINWLVATATTSAA